MTNQEILDRFFIIENGVLYRKNNLSQEEINIFSDIKQIKIPEGVTSIGVYAFMNCDSLESVTIPEGVTYIGIGAFGECRSLKSIAIPEGITSLDLGTFRECESLESITIPEGITSIDNETFNGCRSLKSIIIPKGVTSIGAFAFMNCESLESITIPEGVTSIGNAAFSGCRSLKSITIPKGVTSIGVYAFRNCESLESITIPEGVKSIDNETFNGCRSLKSITIPEGVTSIGVYAFSDCESLESVTIPKGVTSIDNETFSGCRSLKSITIPEGVTSIGSEAFRGCESLSSITIPEGVTSIGDAAFSGCRSLKFITIPEGVKSIGTGTFRNCESLSSITMPEGVTSIDNETFNGCRSLKSITIPKGVTSIGVYAFMNCDSLESITIPEGVTSIGDAAFRNCDSLESIIIPEGVTSIGSEAFRGCKSLSSITIPEGVTSIDNETFNGCRSLESITIPKGVTSIGAGTFRDCDSLKSVIIPEGVTSIGDAAFSGCDSLESIIIPEGVTSIGDAAFRGCESLSSITIPEGITSIGDAAFSGCISLEFLTIPKEVTSIGGYAFRNCDSLKSITIPEGVKSIGTGAFSGCDSLKSITIPEGITSIGSEAFSGCDSLKSVIIQKGVKSIGTGTFSECDSLESVTIPEGVKSIGDAAFSGCDSLKSITIPEGVTSIGSEAFSECRSLKSITIPKGVTSIGSEAFSGCISLESITIPEGVTSIGDAAFSKCISLKSITIPKGVTSIGSEAFSGCDSLESITIPEGVASIGNAAFSGCRLLKSAIIRNHTDIISSWGTLGDEIKYDITNENIKISKELNQENLFYRIINKYLQYYNVSLLQLIKLRINKSVSENNISFLIALGKKENNIVEFISQNHHIFNQNIIDNIYNNYKYLESQNLVDKEILKNIYFGSNIEFNNAADLSNQITNNEINKNIDLDLLLTLSVENNAENTLDLRDRLVYASMIYYLNSGANKENIDSAKVLLKKNVFSNIVTRDSIDYYNMQIQNTLVEKFDCFAGIKHALTEELKSINPKLIEFFNRYGELKEFVQSLNTVKQWNIIGNQIGEKERARRLKNEVIGRVLFSIIMCQRNKFTSIINNYSNSQSLESIKRNKNNGNMSEEQYRERKKAILSDFFTSDNCVNDTSNINIDYKIDVLSNEFINDFSSYLCEDISAINDYEKFPYLCRMISENPYTFDALNIFDNEGNKKCIYRRFNEIAARFGYLFKDKEYETLDKKVRDKYDIIEAIANSVINDIGITRINDENDQLYLEKVNKLISNYFSKSSSTEEELFSIFRSVDVYLRKNSEYDLQQYNRPDIKELSESIFDINNPEFDNNDRLCYCLFNLNKLAHQIDEVNTRIIELKETRYSNYFSDDKEKIKDALKGYNDLQKYGITVETINSTLSENQELNKCIDKCINKNFNQCCIDGDFEKLKSGLKWFVTKTGKSIDNMTDEEVRKLANEMKKIIDLKADTRRFIEKDAKEQRVFYRTKAIIAKEYLNRLATAIATRSINDSEGFLVNNGYIIECNHNNNGDVLVIYNPKFNEPFSVHMKDLNPNLQQIFNTLASKKCEVSHSKIKAGLCKRKKNAKPKENISFVDSGYIECENNYTRLISVIISNFLRIDAHLIESDITSFLANQNLTIADIEDKMCEIDDLIPVEKPENVMFKDIDVSVLDLYHSVIGYDRLENRKKELENNIRRR